MNSDLKTTALAALLLLVATLAGLGLYSLLGEAADLVLAVLPVVIGAWLVGREVLKRAGMEE